MKNNLRSQGYEEASTGKCFSAKQDASVKP